MISREGSMISASFAQLRDFGFIVTNFNTHRHVKTGAMQRLTDYIIMGDTGIHFIEVKLESTKDTMKPHQVLVKHLITQVSKLTPFVNYWTVKDLEDAHAVFDMILNGTPEQKGVKIGV